jgi:hypothetical protein
MAVAHLQGAQQSNPAQCVETHLGSAFAGALQRRLSLEWNDHTALLASRTASRKGRFAAMWIIEIGSKSRCV